MELDGRTLVIAVSLITILQVAVIFIYYHMNRGNDGVRWWLWGSSIFCIGFLSLLLRDVPSMYEVSLLASNTLIVLGMMGHYVAISRFLGKREVLWVVVAVPLLTVAMLGLFTFVREDFSARTLVVASALAVISYLVVMRLVRERPPAIAFSCNALAAMYTFLAIILMARAIYVVFNPVEGLFTNGWVQTSLFLSMLATSFLFSFGFIIMLNQSLVAEVSQVRDRMELIFNTGPDVAFISRLDDDVVVQGNENFHRLCKGRLGVKVAEAVEAIRKDDGLRGRVLQTLREDGHVDSIEVELLLEGGERFVGTMSARRFSDAGTDLAINVIRDITGRKAAEDMVKESERKYRLLVDKASEAVVVAQDERLKLVNPALAAITGFSEEELIGQPFLDFVHPDDRSMILENYNKRFRNESLPERYDFRVLQRSGGVRWAEVSAIVITWEGRPATLNFITDITDRKQAEQALKESNRKLNLLSGITRHDISNQLIALSGRLELLGSGIGDPKALEHISKAQASAERIYAMIQFTKEYENVGVSTPRWHNLSDLVNGEVEDVPQGRIKVINDIPADLELYADPLVSKVFHNLISNAVKHGGDLTQIRFSIEDGENGRAIVCEDDGVGIPEEFRGRLFNRGVGRDHGFGLFLSREILLITGITIHDERATGRGARFVMTPPVNGLRAAG